MALVRLASTRRASIPASWARKDVTSFTFLLLVLVWPVVVLYLGQIQEASTTRSVLMKVSARSLTENLSTVDGVGGRKDGDQALFGKKDQDGSQARPSVMAFVGVQTGFTQVWNPTTPKKYVYELRREQLRRTWFPPNLEAMNRMEAELGIVMRFVIGHTDNATAEAILLQEEAMYGPMLRLPIKERYVDLAWKSQSFFREVTKHWDAAFIIKVDDDVYMRPDRLAAALPGYAKNRLGYIGCMKRGPVVKTAGRRWYEPQHELLGGGQYFTHAWGPMYILSGAAAKIIAGHSDDELRHFVNEDVTIGAWMMVFNVRSFDDRRLCTNVCKELTIGSYPLPTCPGLCNPVDDLPLWHSNPNCSSTPALPPGSLVLPMYKPRIPLANVTQRV